MQFCKLPASPNFGKQVFCFRYLVIIHLWYLIHGDFVIPTYPNASTPLHYENNRCCPLGMGHRNYRTNFLKSLNFSDHWSLQCIDQWSGLKILCCRTFRYVYVGFYGFHSAQFIPKQTCVFVYHLLPGFTPSHSDVKHLAPVPFDNVQPVLSQQMKTFTSHYYYR